MIWLTLALIGVFVGAFGTLIGAAGGFILVPILLFMYPDYSPASITSITLTVAFFNALSGSLAYSRLKRIDYRSGLLFAMTGIPGAVIGANITGLLSRDVFQLIFGLVLLLVSFYLFFKPNKPAPASINTNHCTREITDNCGNTFKYSYSKKLGLVIAFFVGLVSGMLGIGGGIIHVPAMTHLLSYPVHIATATSHFVISLTTVSALATHIINNVFTEGALSAFVLSAGAVVGAQFGARYSFKLSGVLIVRLLASGLLLVSARLILTSF
ncbi:MAG: sulfite exporter TauE/SafE family protein [Dehalococcoidaceae bacterium]|nr:sulfite exporter TauE/SafE family protein [Dehalococcoidaceae bacterium]